MESLDLLFQRRSLHICPNRIFQPDHDDDCGGDNGDGDGDGDDGLDLVQLPLENSIWLDQLHKLLQYW